MGQFGPVRGSERVYNNNNNHNNCSNKVYFIHFYYKIVKCKWLTKSIFSFLACRVMKDVSIAWSGAEMESRLMA